MRDLISVVEMSAGKMSSSISLAAEATTPCDGLISSATSALWVTRELSSYMAASIGLAARATE